MSMSMSFMEKRTLNHHASTVLAKCEQTGEFILGEYDPGYPVVRNKHWIGRAKLLGGNHFYGKDSDISPYSTLNREINEEFSGEQASKDEIAGERNIEKFAKQEDINYVRKILLDTEPLQDYFLYHPGQGDTQGAFVIQSVFRARDVTKDAIDTVKRYNLDGGSLTNEGLVVVKSLKDLKQGHPFCQGITGLVIGQTEGVHVASPCDDDFLFEPIGLSRDSYEAYSDRFQYRNHSKK